MKIWETFIAKKVLRRYNDQMACGISGGTLKQKKDIKGPKALTLVNNNNISILVY